MTNEQQAMQGVLNADLNATVQRFAVSCDVDLQTVLNALDDAKADASTVYHNAKQETT